MPHWSFAADADGGVPGLVHATGCVAALPDHVVPVGNRSFRLGGRVDGAVQVGGINVHVDRIENLLADRPGVQAAAVRLMGTERGARLKAFIVPDPGTDAGDLENDLSEWLAEHLPAPERPTSFTFGPNLPISGLGKPIDW